MKWNRYIMRHHLDNGQMLVYNYSNDKVLLLTHELVDVLKSIEPNWDKISEIHKDLYASLVEQNFLLPDDFDEVRQVKEQIRGKLASHEVLRLTVNPTLDCNMRCWYCYESHTTGQFMSKETMQGIVSFVRMKSTEPSMRILALSFFGGEPLLRAHEIALPLMRELVEVCTLNGKEADVHFTTNGVLLTRHVVDEICSISRRVGFQIPLDGNRTMHDKVKCTGKGSGTYDIVLKNIAYLQSKGLHVNIRCNYDEGNIDSFTELVDDVASFPNLQNGNVRFTLQRLWQCTASSKLQEKVEALRNYIADKGFSPDEYNMSVSPHCYADYDGSIVVNYNGDLFKCTARDFLHDNRIGELGKDGNIEYTSRAKLYRDFPFFKDCDECAILPVCSKCRQNRIEQLAERDYCKKYQDTEAERNLIYDRLNALYPKC